MWSNISALKKRLRHAILTCGVLAVGIGALGQSSVAPDKLAEQVEIFSSRAFTHCGNAHYSGPFERPRVACLEAQGSVKSCQIFFEAGEAGEKPFRAESDTAPLTMADQRNGLEWRGYITFTYPLFRTRFQADGKWFMWSKSFDQPQGEATVAQFWKENGQWFVRDLRDTSDFIGQSSAEVQAVVGRDETLDHFVKALRPLSCPDITNPTPHTAVLLSTPESPEFNGTVEQFAAEFPGYLQRAEIARGKDPATYQKEAAFIVETVRTCSLITYKVAHKAMHYGGETYLDFDKLDPQFRICRDPILDASERANPEYKKLDLKIFLELNSAARSSPKAENGYFPLVVDVTFFAGPRGDSHVKSSKIVKATIP